MRVADYIVKRIYEAGAQHIFMVTGRGALFLNDAVAAHGEIKSICMHHEQSLTMAMQTYYSFTKKITVALVTAGGASANAITGVISAWADTMPCIVISGQENLKYVKKFKKNNARMWGI